MNKENECTALFTINLLYLKTTKVIQAIYEYANSIIRVLNLYIHLIIKPEYHSENFRILI